MKWLILLLFLTGCNDYHPSVGRSLEPKYNYNDSVTIYSGFYKGHSAIIYNYKECWVRLDNESVIGSWCYNIELVDEKGRPHSTGYVSEQELTK